MNSMRTVRPRGAVPRRHTAPGGKHQRKGPAWRWHGEARSSRMFKARREGGLSLVFGELIRGQTK